MACYLKKTTTLARNEKAYLLECDSAEDKVNLLSQLTVHDAQQPEVRRLAELVTMRASTPDEGAELLHALVRDGVTFAPEQIETFSPTLWTLQTKRGDCDDSARALAALLLSIGYSLRS
jgi:transglutaminase-like putative cysteine protease